MIQRVMNSEKMQVPATECTGSINRLLAAYKQYNTYKQMNKDFFQCNQIQEYSSNKEYTPCGEISVLGSTESGKRLEGYDG